MNDDKIIELTGKIEETLGKEIVEEAKEKLSNEKLVSANGALLQKLPVARSEDDETSVEETPKKINLKDAFDKNGNFLH